MQKWVVVLVHFSLAFSALATKVIASFLWFAGWVKIIMIKALPRSYVC